MVCAEWWAFEILAIFAGWITVEALGAHSIIIQFEYLSYMIPAGIAVAAQTRVGNSLGANDPKGAIRAVKVSCAIVIRTYSS
jgi:MATE family multidrug resistance protein